MLRRLGEERLPAITLAQAGSPYAVLGSDVSSGRRAFQHGCLTRGIWLQSRGLGMCVVGNLDLTGLVPSGIWLEVEGKHGRSGPAPNHNIA